MDTNDEDPEEQDEYASKHVGMSPRQEAIYRQMLRDRDARSDAESQFIQAQNLEVDHLIEALVTAGSPLEFVARSVEHLGPPDQDPGFLRSRIRNAFSLYARDLPAWEKQGEAWPIPENLGYTLEEDEKRALQGEARDVRGLTTIARQLLDAFWNLDGAMPVAFVASVLTPAGIRLGMDVASVGRMVKEQARRVEPGYDQVDVCELRDWARAFARVAKLAVAGRPVEASADLVGGMADALEKVAQPHEVARATLEAIVRAEAKAVGLELNPKAKGGKPKRRKPADELRDTYDWEDD